MSTASDEPKEPTPEEYKEQGNLCIKDGNYKEAVALYSTGLRMNPSDFFLYSNRSFAFLKLKLYYYALSDADKVIELRPDFIKGYFRKAEVLRET